MGEFAGWLQVKGIFMSPKASMHRVGRLIGSYFLIQMVMTTGIKKFSAFRSLSEIFTHLDILKSMI